MPDLEFFAVAESLSVDQTTNRLSLFNILEEVQVMKLPPGVVAAPPQFVAVSSWNMAPEDSGKKFRVSLKFKMEGRDHVELGSVEFETNRRRQRVFLGLIGFPAQIEAACDLRFEIFLDGTYKASHLISATLAEASSEQPVVTDGKRS